MDLLAMGPLDGATETALPGLQTFKGLVLGLIPYALVACVAAFVIGAILWAVGAFGHNPQHSSNGVDPVWWTSVKRPRPLLM